MVNLITVRGHEPVIGGECFIAPNAFIIGDVIAGNNCSFWFNAVVRGDVNSIRIGNFTNIQDGAVIHATYERSTTTIGDYVSIGHNAVVHGCIIKDHVLIGINAVVLDGAVIEPYCIIAAGAVILENTICESGYIYAGIPARQIKAINSLQRESLNKTPHNYVLYASWFSELD